MRISDQIMEWIDDARRNNYVVKNIQFNPKNFLELAIEQGQPNAKKSFFFIGTKIEESLAESEDEALVEMEDGASSVIPSKWRVPMVIKRDLVYDPQPTRRPDQCPVNFNHDVEPRTFSSFSYQYCVECKEDVEHLAKSQTVAVPQNNEIVGLNKFLTGSGVATVPAGSIVNVSGGGGQTVMPAAAKPTGYCGLSGCKFCTHVKP